MFNNIVVSGCSFTSAPEYDWPLALVQHFDSKKHVNLARSGAGNRYISDSIIDCLSTDSSNPKDTLVLVMWSGPSRIDLTIDEEFYNMLRSYGYDYACKQYSKHYLFSGGQLGSWNQNSLIRQVFESLYKVKDETVLAIDTLDAMHRTQTFLEQQGYTYAFMSYVNYWADTDQYVSDMDKSLTYYAGHTTVYQKVKQAPWIWTDTAQNGLYEFAKQRKMLESDNFHPTATAHQQFAEQVIIPYIERHIL